MIRKEFKTMTAYNPFIDDYVDLDCEFECHIDSRGKLDHVVTASVINEEGVELTKYLNQDWQDSLADVFYNEHGAEV